MLIVQLQAYCQAVLYTNYQLHESEPLLKEPPWLIFQLQAYCRAVLYTTYHLHEAEPLLEEPPC
jgi:hypothetical protein